MGTRPFKRKRVQPKYVNEKESLEKVTNDDILVEIDIYNSEPVFLFDLFGLWPTFQLG